MILIALELGIENLVILYLKKCWININSNIVLWFFSLLILMLISISTSLFAATKLSEQEIIARKLGWITSVNSYNLCGGYYKEFPIIYIPNPYVKSQKHSYDIHADSVVLPLRRGTFVFKNNVVVTQPQRQLTANLAYAYRDKKTGKVNRIEAIGNVRMREPAQLVIAKKATFYVQSKKITLHNVHYRIARTQTKAIIRKNPQTGKLERRIYQLSAHGKATKVTRVNQKLTILKNATYSTCQPDCQVWKLRGSTVKLNSATGRGEAWNSRFYWHNVPFFYFPYFNFPIDNKRHTGFLTPVFHNSSNNGFSVATPFYWNIAPNYDATLTPNFIFSRGIMLQSLFHYLTHYNNGYFKISYLPNDKRFRKFKKDAATEWPKASQFTLRKLEKASVNRKAFTWQDTARFNQHWSSYLNFNYVSDSYYIKDFGNSLLDDSNNQLLRQYRLVYADNVWNFASNFQAYQTLHRVDQSSVSNQYARLPQLQLSANAPYHPLGLYFGFNSDFTRFTFHRNPYHDTSHIVGISSRGSLRPFVSLPLNWPFAYVVPRMQLQMTKYRLPSAENNFHQISSVAIPMFDMRGGLYFDRTANLFKHRYDQTLEPIIYYLYVPYRNQNGIPCFDTGKQKFDYDFMFLDNRFTGIDRIGDANQVTLGVTTRFIDADTGKEKAEASVGRIYYFRHRRLQLSGDPIRSQDRRPASPIAAAATYHFNPVWSAKANLTWNTAINMFDDRNVGVQYEPDARHIINVSYTYSRQGSKLPWAPPDSPENDLKQTNVAGYWQINKHWSIMGRWNYSWSHAHGQAYLYGISYDSCCWAVRFVWARTFVSLGPAPDYTQNYDKTYYIEIALKGLGTVANTDPSGFLTKSITGYNDIFGQET